MRNQLSYLPDEENPDYGRPPWAAAVGMDMPGIAGQPQQDMPPPAAEPRLQLRRPEMLDTAPPDVGPMPDAAPADTGETQGNSASPWAVVADLLLNKGRGLGGILALGAAGRGQDRDLERRYKEAQIQHLTNPHTSDPEMMAWRLASLDARNNAIANVQNRAEKNWQRADDPYSQHNMTAEDMAGRKRASAEQAALDVAHTNTERTGADKAQIAGGERAAVLGATHDLAPLAAADAAAQAAAVSNAQMPNKLAEKAAPGPAPGKVAAADLVPIPGFSIDLPDVYGNVQGNPARAEKLQAGAASAMTLDSAVSRMREISKSGPRMLPDEQKSQYDAAYGDAIGALTTMYNSGVLNQQEYERYKQQLPTLNYGMPEVADIWGALARPNQTTNTRQSMLEGFQKGTRELNAVKFRTLGGIRPNYDGEAGAAPADNPLRTQVTGVGRGPGGQRAATAATPSIPDNASATSAPIANDPNDGKWVLDNHDGTYDLMADGQVREGQKISPQKLKVMIDQMGWQLQ